MLRDALNALFGRSVTPDAGGNRTRHPATDKPPPPPLERPHTRPSPALAQFFGTLENRANLRILDLSGASQANINFVLQLGHHLYCEDLITSMETIFGTGDDFYARQADEELSHRFFEETLGSLPGTFDGALVWDTLQFLQPPLLDTAVRHLHRLLDPGAQVFVFFPSLERVQHLPINSYRIESASSVHVVPRGWREMTHPFTNRNLERTFGNFSAVKFFLSREYLRELIVTR